MTSAGIRSDHMIFFKPAAYMYFTADMKWPLQSAKVEKWPDTFQHYILICSLNDGHGIEKSIIPYLRL